MTATAAIEEVVCLRSATSADFDPLAMIRNLFRPGHQLPGAGFVHQLSGIGGVGRMVQGVLDETPVPCLHQPPGDLPLEHQCVLSR